MKKIIILLLLTISLISCNITYDYVIVDSVKILTNHEYKYKVRLRFYPVNQILFTDSLVNVGDTLSFYKQWLMSFFYKIL